MNVDIASIENIKNIIKRRPKGNSENRAFVRSCPKNNCTGFLSTQWKCGMCDSNVCKHCHEIKVKDEEHVCNEDNVKTAELLMKDSKPCPSCSAMIFKIEGCDQMYCVMCHTAFSWNTGMIEKGLIHNPHYYEIQRQLRGGNIPRQPGDIPCGGAPAISEFFNHLHKVIGNGVTEKKLMEKLRLYHHIEAVTLLKYPVVQTEELFRELRIQYMIKQISEETFKTKLQRIEKCADKNREISEVYRTYQNVLIDIFRNIMGTNDPKMVEKEFENIKSLEEYVNGCFDKIAKRYNIVPAKIG
jgi:hypothetical protein